MATRSSLASPDQNRDLVVDAVDLALVTAKVGGQDPTADFDCDGAVTAADLAVAQAHEGHTGLAATPTRAGSWGRLKVIYR